MPGPHSLAFGGHGPGPGYGAMCPHCPGCVYQAAEDPALHGVTEVMSHGVYQTAEALDARLAGIYKEL